MSLTEEFFSSRSLASVAAAQRVAGAIRRSLAVQPQAALVVSGGSTPEDTFQLLADTDLRWDKVHIMLSDERCVPVDHEASNEGMIRRLLVTHRAASAKLVSIYESELSPEDQCGAVTEKLKSVPSPFSISLLGMGEDGHFASLFPDFDRLKEGADPDSDLRCMLVRTAASPHPRITLTMSTLLQCNEILLLFFGDTKRETYERAKLPDGDYPVSRLLQQQRTPVHTIWAP
jgi:6-phosphogluconolactonase